MRSIALAGIFTALVLLGAVMPAAPVHANTIQVDNMDDDIQVQGLCSLREAVLAANLDTTGGGDCDQGSGPDVIQAPAGTMTIGFLSTMVILEDLEIVGQGSESTIIDGADTHRIFIVEEGVELSFSRMTLRNGSDTGLEGGGAVDNKGSLVIDDSVLEENHADRHGGAINTTGDTMLHIEDSVLRRNDAGLSGGAIAAGGGPCGVVTLLRVAIQGNSAGLYGGGVNSCAELTLQESIVASNNTGWAGGGLLNQGPAVIQDSVVSGNDVDGDMEQNGGGIRNSSIATLTLERSLVSDNTADHGGGISNAGEATLINSTLSNNFGISGSNFASGHNDNGGPAHATLLNVTISSQTSGTVPQGVIIVADTGIGGPLGTVELRNTIIAADEDSNCVDSVTIVSLGHNISTDGTCDVSAVGDQKGVNPLLGPLADNGGFTRTYPLLPGSPALGEADQVACPDDDQRGEPRPQGDGCDIGAYESALSAPTPSPSPTASATPTATAASPTPEPTATPTPTTPPGEELIWGDDNCSGEPEPIDALLTLRFDAGLSADTGACPELGEVVDVQNASLHPWGDVDCSGPPDPIDALKLLRFDAGLAVASVPGCPDIGDPVVIS